LNLLSWNAPKRQPSFREALRSGDSVFCVKQPQNRFSSSLTVALVFVIGDGPLWPRLLYSLFIPPRPASRFRRGFLRAPALHSCCCLAAFPRRPLLGFSVQRNDPPLSSSLGTLLKSRHPNVGSYEDVPLPENAIVLLVTTEQPIGGCREMEVRSSISDRRRSCPSLTGALRLRLHPTSYKGR
jgi:hypothetical protein